MEQIQTIKGEYYPKQQQWVFSVDEKPFFTYLLEDTPTEMIDYFAKQEGKLKEGSIADIEDAEEREDVINWYTTKLFGTKEFGNQMIKWIKADLDEIETIEDVENLFKEYNEKPINISEEEIGFMDEDENQEPIRDTKEMKEKVESLLQDKSLQFIKNMMRGATILNASAIHFFRKAGVDLTDPYIVENVVNPICYELAKQRIESKKSAQVLFSKKKTAELTPDMIDWFERYNWTETQDIQRKFSEDFNVNSGQAEELHQTYLEQLAPAGSTPVSEATNKKSIRNLLEEQAPEGSPVMKAEEENKVNQLEMGKKVEMEHAQTIKQFMKEDVKVEEVAEAIAADHLKELPDYYSRLKKMEASKKTESKKSSSVLEDFIGGVANQFIEDNGTDVSEEDVDDFVYSDVWYSGIESFPAGSQEALEEAEEMLKVKIMEKLGS